MIDSILLCWLASLLVAEQDARVQLLLGCLCEYTFSFQALQPEFRNSGTVPCKSLRLCAHLVPEHSGTGTKWCCVQTLGTRYIIAQFSTEYQGETFYSGNGTVPQFWPGYLKKGVFTLVLIKNRSRVPCSGAMSERSLKLVLGHQMVLRYLKYPVSERSNILYR